MGICWAPHGAAQLPGNIVRHVRRGTERDAPSTIDLPVGEVKRCVYPFGTHTLRFCEPPPVDRQMKLLLA
jgi:hypothetical protein